MKMKKYIILIIFMGMLLPITSAAQTKLDATQQKQIISKIDKSAQAMKTMQCKFNQTKSMKMLSKKMESNGVMFFKTPDKLRWQYVAPYDYTFIMNGDKVRMKSSKSTQDVSVSGNKMFRQITSIILNSITGGCLSSQADFRVELFKQGNAYYAQMYPKKKELKQIYSMIRIRFNPELTMVSTVEMIEKTGDATVVNLTNVKINQTIDESQFNIR